MAECPRLTPKADIGHRCSNQSVLYSEQAALRGFDYEVDLSQCASSEKNANNLLSLPGRGSEKQLPSRALTSLVGSKAMALESAPVNFEDILRTEIESINKRRRELRRYPLASDKSHNDAVGLALSGGGIRSAAISLGVLQALDYYGVLNKIDYLSTVSGGGYIGSSVTATMTVTEGKFVFNPQWRIAESSFWQVDTPAVAHLRDYSNYLLAGGKHNFGSAVAIVVRGLIANFAIVLLVLLYLSALFLLTYEPYYAAVTPLFKAITNVPSFFPVTAVLFAGGVILFLLWALYLSFRSRLVMSEESSKLPIIAWMYLVLVSLALFAELQPSLIFVYAKFNNPYDDRVLRPSSEYFIPLLYTLYVVAIVGIPFGLGVAYFQRQLGVTLNRGRTTSGVARLALLSAAVELPLLLWILFIHLCALGIPVLKRAPLPGDDQVSFLLNYLPSRFGIVGLYILVATGLLIFATLLKPNAVTLHGLYRDRLRRAFLFDARYDPSTLSSFERSKPVRFPALDLMRVSDISAAHAPYHLINAALNIRGSSYANQRGRDADFFIFSPNYVGSSVTGYVPTIDFEKAETSFDLAAAVAVSGAAVSSSMGAKSIRLLAPTLAVLNIRLGYWLRNPRRLFQSPSLLHRWTTRSIHYLWAEARSQLYTDTSNEVYVTDGGHIENLGLYELLHRQCKVIMCVDAEADPDMRFSSLITLQRYASIDLGIQIDLPWQQIQETSIGWMGYDPIKQRGKKQATHGPHAAVGTIYYRDGQKGFLLYIKASLTGDERDYITDYVRRHPAFPHEPTGNQFFNEEQFEVYRALGYHIAHGILSGRDDVVSLAADLGARLTRFNREEIEKVDDPIVKEVSQRLLKEGA